MLNHKVKIKLCHLGPLVAQMTINHSKHEGGKKKTHKQNIRMQISLNNLVIEQKCY